MKLREEIQFNVTSLKVDSFVHFGDYTPTEDMKTSLVNHALVFMFVAVLFNLGQPVAAVSYTHLDVYKRQ